MAGDCVQEQRVRFIHDWQKQEESMAELCRRHGVSRRVGYKWLGATNKAVLTLSKTARARSQRHPNQTPPEIEQRILDLRGEHSRWGPTTLKAVLERHDDSVDWPARLHDRQPTPGATG